MSNDIIIFILGLQLLQLIYIITAVCRINKQCLNINNDIQAGQKSFNKFSYYSRRCSTLSMFALRAKAVDLLDSAIKSEEYEEAGYYKWLIQEIDKALETQS